jgi:hypothetical protein
VSETTGAALKDLCARVDAAFGELVGAREFPEQADARAFGGFVEQVVLRTWPELCRGWKVDCLGLPGRRTIYDAAFVTGDGIVGIDIRTKDLARERYSDGGVCAVGNLLRRMVKEKATLVISEFGYTIDDGVASFEYVASAPIHVLPLDVYRIENLGTGQIRLDRSVGDSLGAAEWDRSPEAFFTEFASLCVAHYRRVQERAALRIEAIDAFVESGFSEVALK